MVGNQTSNRPNFAIASQAFAAGTVILRTTVVFVCVIFSVVWSTRIALTLFACPLMGWPGGAPAPPASEAGRGRQSQGARHVSASQHDDRRYGHRYRQELVPRGSARSARRDRAAAEVVAWPGGVTASQYATLPDRDGGVRRGTSSQPQAQRSWSRRPADAGEVRPAVFEGPEERLP